MENLCVNELEKVNGGKGWDQVYDGIMGAGHIVGGIMEIPYNPAAGMSNIGKEFDQWRHMINEQRK